MSRYSLLVKAERCYYSLVCIPLGDELQDLSLTARKQFIVNKHTKLT